MARTFGSGIGALGFGLVALFSGACTEDATRPALPSTTIGNPQRAEVVGASGTTSASLTAAGCEDVGSFANTAVAAQLVDTNLESTTWTASDRPQPARMTVLASGVAASLVGKTVALGTGDNANFETCTHCFVVAIGCGADCSKAAFFYPRAGTATFTALSAATGGTFQGHLENADLEQVTLDTGTDHSTPVPNGSCMHVTSLDFKATVAKSPTGGSSGTAATTSSSSSSSSGGTSSGAPASTPVSGGTGGGGHKTGTFD